MALSLTNPLSFSRKDLLCTMSGIVKDFNCKLSLEPTESKTSEADIGLNIFENERDFKNNPNVKEDHHKPLI